MTREFELEDDDPCYPAGLPEQHVPHEPEAEQTTCTVCGQAIKYIHAPHLPSLGHWVDMSTDLVDVNGQLQIVKTFKREEI